jgi:hypothetical protein
MSNSKIPRRLFAVSGFVVLALAILAGELLPIQASPPPKEKENHPHIHSAIIELKAAKKELQTAAHDFGGHRVSAMKACDDAISQLETTLKFDKK